MRKGHQSWVFASKPAIVATATVVGPFEGQGPLADDFDIIHGDMMMEQESWEKAENMLMEEAVSLAIEHSGLTREQIHFMIAGDLMNQITSSSFSARTMQIPFLGVFGACSTSMESLALAACLIEAGAADYAVAATVSHNATAEKQFRYPTEYGSQKPPTAQYTVTGSGAAVVARADLSKQTKDSEFKIDRTSDQVAGQSGDQPAGRVRITAATIGRVIDMGIKDPFNMGAAMAPAAVDTIEAHLRDLEIEPNHYDLIVTGDLAQLGHAIALDLFKTHNIAIDGELYHDCGMKIYDYETQQVQSGGSGCGCCAVVTYGHWLRKMLEGTYRRILVVATGALLSPLSFQQGESIPCIAHAVAFEREEGE
jgi:stage V sporulation protein AD